jgi:hypothetical protein
MPHTRIVRILNYRALQRLATRTPKRVPRLVLPALLGVCALLPLTAAQAWGQAGGQAGGQAQVLESSVQAEADQPDSAQRSRRFEPGSRPRIC